MRQHKRGPGREGRRSWAPGHRSDGAGGRILDLGDAAQLPQRYRLELLEFGRRFPREVPWATAWDGEIVDDYLDGQRVYPEPPRRTRPVDRFGRLLERATAPVWFFVLLAALQAGVAVAGIVSPLLRPGPDAPSMTLHLAYVCALSLLPAAVLIWRPDAWRSARLVLGGAIAWTTVPSLASLTSAFVALAPPLEARFGPASQIATGVAAALACLGPLAMAFGLAHVRRSRLEWLGPLAWRATAVAALPVMYSASRWLAPAVSNSTRSAAGNAAGPDLAGSIAGAFAPAELFGLGILACLCLSAVLAEEPQSRLWQCGTAGTVLLVGAGLYELLEGPLPGWELAGELQLRDWYTLPAAGALVAGVGLVLLAFTSAAWSTARDAAGEEPGAPDEVFTWGPAGWDGSRPIPMQAIVAVAAGADHALALDRAGRVAAWGDDSMGQTDIPAGLAGVVAVAAGDGFSLALRHDGKVFAWGANDHGQASVPDDLAGVTAIAAGRTFALALKSDGTVVGWGDASTGVLPVPATLFGVTAISAGAYHALALRLDGTVVAWGDNSYGQSRVPSWLPAAQAISAGGDFSLALRADGVVSAWGDNSYGQLDVPVGLTDVTAISAGAFHAVALLARGDVVGWGGGRQRGEGGHPWHLVDFKAVAAGDGFSLAVRAA